MVDALVSIALEKLADVLGQQLTLFAGATDDLQKLQKTFQHIEAVLHDAERKQVREETTRLWLSELRQIAYDVDDLLDKCLISALEKDGSDDDVDSADGDESVNRVRPTTACLLPPYNFLDQAMSRYKVARKIKEIRERLDQIAKNKEQFSTSHINSSGGDRRLVRRSRTLTSSHMEEEMIGRNDDKDAVISRLVSETSSDDGKVQVIAIVGIGGLGKTTLARKIYHDDNVRNHFGKFLWVCVSDDFDLERLTKAITEQVKKTSTSFSELESLQNELLEALRGEHFLLVLDDVWNDDQDKWNRLWPCLKSGAPGSRIIVTTRLQKVAAKTMNASYIHELKGLSIDDCWTLFSSIAFDEWKEEEYLQFESIGKDIVRKCKGVPLSVKVMGSAMNSKRTVFDWQNISDSEMWSLPEAENKILPALWLSYYNLPSHLKQCFVYCSVYPKDTTMHKAELVRLWIAQGFIQLQGNREREDIAGEYFDDLIVWSIFQESSKDGKSCKMHDLLHDLAEFLSKDEIYIYAGEKSNQCDKNIRHASLFLSENNPKVLMAFRGVTKLRTLFLHGVGLHTTLVDLCPQTRFLRTLIFRRSNIRTLPKIIEKLKHLRYLDLSRTNLAELPNAIGKLKSLRYLDLSRTELVELPESVCCLPNLHTLDLNYCYGLKKLPRGIGGMVNLRRLLIEGTSNLEYLPKGLGRISSLERLCKFIVGGEGGCSIDELQQLNSVQGNLTIENLEKVLSGEEAKKAELWNKSYLGKLVLRVSERARIVTPVSDVELKNMDSALEVLRPHANLEELQLVCHRSSKLPSWMEDLAFSKLTKLEIRGSSQNLPGLGKLPSLKYLTIRASGMKKIGHELYYGSSGQDVVGRRSRVAFPKLERLFLDGMNELEEWELTCAEADTDTIIMPYLQDLRLENCLELVGLPHHLVNAPLTSLRMFTCPNIKGTGCSSFSLLETFCLRYSGTFFSSGLPKFPKLEVLDVRHIRNETLPDDGAWDPLMGLRKFRIEDCHELKYLPDGLRHLQSLENLRILGCEKLEQLPQELGRLKKLKSIQLSGLEALTCLPDSLRELESLEDLDMSDMTILRSLPEGFGQLKKLKSLTIGGAKALTCLPESLGELESLEYLSMLAIKLLRSLPEGFGQLKKLNSLTIGGAEVLTCLPDSLVELESLEVLHMNDMKILRLLPEGFGQLKKLKSLKISGAEALTCLPDSLGELESLGDLYMDGMKILWSLPEGFGQLKKLKSLRIGGAEALTCLPDSLGELESLEKLGMNNMKVLQLLPEGFGQLKKLKSLTMGGAEALTCLPDSLRELESLEDLDMDGMKILQSLPEGFGQLEKLKTLRIGGAEALTCLPDSLAQLESLEYLEITGLVKLESLPRWFGRFKKLSSLIITNMEALTISLPNSPGQLESLKKLEISRCKALKLIPRGLGQLESLTIGPLQSSTRLPNMLGQLKSLKLLIISDWNQLESLPPWLRQLKALRSLTISGCTALSHGLQNLPSLNKLEIFNCPLLSERCKREGGEDWCKISHIPKIRINGRQMHP